MSDFVKTYFEEVMQIVNNLNLKKIDELATELDKIRKIDGRIFFLGVGGSAANASHAVNDFRKLCKFECYAPTDNVSELSARTNDEGWDTVFESWLHTSRANKNDCIFIFSVGGGNEEKNVSMNLVNATKYASRKKIKTFAILGRNDGFVYNNSDISILVPNVSKSRITPHSEAFQAVIWHCLVSHPLLQKNNTKW